MAGLETDAQFLGSIPKEVDREEEEEKKKKRKKKIFNDG